MSSNIYEYFNYFLKLKTSKEHVICFNSNDTLVTGLAEIWTLTIMVFLLLLKFGETIDANISSDTFVLST